MKRLIFLFIVLLGVTSAALGQNGPPDSQPMRALLSEVRELRKDLHASLGKIQVAQILLARLQIQELAVTRAAQHLDQARSKLAEAQVVVRSETAEVKALEEASSDSSKTQGEIDQAVSRAKADLEASTNLADQLRATESEAEQELRTEQEKLDRLENQLDELVRAMTDANEQSRLTPAERPEGEPRADSQSQATHTRY